MIEVTVDNVGMDFEIDVCEDLSDRLERIVKMHFPMNQIPVDVENAVTLIHDLGDRYDQAVRTLLSALQEMHGLVGGER